MYVSVNRVSIGSDYGLSPFRRQTIIYANAGLLSIGPFGTNHSDIFNQNTKLFVHKYESEKIVWEMAAILSKSRWLNDSDV